MVTIQTQRIANFADISRVASISKIRIKKMTIAFKDMLIDDYNKNKESYNRELKSSQLAIKIMTGEELQENRYAIDEMIEDLSSKDILLDNPKYGASRQAIIGLYEKEFGKDKTNILFNEAKELAKKKVSEDFQKRLPEIYNHFNKLFQT